MHDVGQEAQAREGAQRGGEGERAAAAAVQQSPATPIFPTGAVQPERTGARSSRGPRRVLSHGNGYCHRTRTVPLAARSAAL